MFVVLMAAQMVFFLAAKSFSWKIKIILTDADMLTCPGPAVLCFALALAGIFSSPPPLTIPHASEEDAAPTNPHIPQSQSINNSEINNNNNADGVNLMQSRARYTSKANHGNSSDPDKIVRKPGRNKNIILNVN